MSAEPTLKETTARGLLWGGLRSGSVQFIGILFNIYLARTLDIDDYGLVAMLAIFTSIASTLIESGFTVALTNKKNATHADFNAVFWFNTIMSLLLYTVLFFLAPVIARFFERPELTAIGRVVFISFVFSGISTVFHAVLFKRLMVKEQARIDIIAVIVSGVVGVSMAYMGKGYWSIVAQSVVFICLSNVLKIVAAPWRPTFEFDFAPIREMFPFSVNLLLTNIVVQINKNIFSPILGKLYGGEQLGLYSQGEKWMGMGSNIISGMVNSVAHPVLVQVSDEPKRFLNVFRKMIRFAAFVAFPAMLGIAFIGQEFILITIGEKWLPSVPILQMLCVVGAFTPIWQLYTHVILTCKRSDLFLFGNILQGVLQIVMIILVARWGIYWMVLTYVGTYFVSLLFWHYHVSRLTGFRFMQLLKDILPYLSIVIIVFAVVWLITLPFTNVWLVLIGKIVLAAVLYCVVLWYSGSVLFRESIEMLMRRIRKIP